MNEVQAAYGMLQLKYIDNNIKKRKAVADEYRRRLRGVEGLRIFENIAGVIHSYSYFPVFFDEALFGRSREDIYMLLRKNNIFSRRYFYPLISHFPTYRGLPSAHPGNLHVASDAAEKVLCLPIYSEMEPEIIGQICDLILGSRS
jgi:dTDP-4-amino-4,6-dideoxygalactose transaminase